MKILQVQDHLKSGGAARAAGRWAELLGQSEGEVLQAAGDEVSSHGYLLTGKPARGWGRMMESLTGKSGRKSKVETHLRELLEKNRPGLVWFHNIAGGGKWGWSEQMVMQARQYAPVLWTLHDMWGLGNGDKTYWEVNSSVESGRWKGVGGSGQGARLQKVCGAEEKYPIQLTAPSRWLAELASKVTGQRCSFLPNPIDLSIFCPGDRVAARRRLGLPDQGMIILAGADSLQDRRKGFDLLREAWTLAGKHGATLALFGRHAENRPGERYLGNLSSGGEMVAAFRAADLYVHPARMENAPCQIQESLACGTPVLAFPVGGIPEMIAPGRTGFLADKVSPESLHGALTSVLSNPSRLSGMREECRKTAEVVWRPQSLLEQFEEVAGAVVSGW
jgi:glycosyltransferase involved in cell wall biosynthesis